MADGYFLYSALMGLSYLMKNVSGHKDANSISISDFNHPACKGRID